MSRETLLLEALALKALPRAGWVRAGISAPESVAAHSWGVAWLALLLCPDDLDLRQVLTIALVHDLPELRVGDITPHDGIPATEKRRREADAAQALLGGEPTLLAAWQEYEDHQTPASRFVHQLDKLDMALQALRYQHDQGRATTEFLESARARLPASLWAWVAAAAAASATAEGGEG